MSQQHEILRSAPLLNASGDLAEPGWARSLLPVYRRSDIRVSPMRIKVAPAICFVGFVSMIYAIIHKPKDSDKQ